MPQSLAKILVHVIFSTKNREPFPGTDALRREVNSYLAGVLRNCDSPAILAGSTTDHVHILCSLSKNRALCDVIEEIKKSSSRWLKTKGPSLRGFHWQSGYGAFSVSQSNAQSVQDYIADQDRHHQRLTFQDEFRRFLKKYRVPFDERYVWD